MSDHADTIRRYITSPLPDFEDDALAALDALVAENQLLRDALKAIFEVASVAHNGDPWYCENEGVDAHAAFVLAQAALDGTPSAPQTLEDTPPHKESRSSSNAS